jgi:thiamine-phosphate pyrophosphorylase
VPSPSPVPLRGLYLILDAATRRPRPLIEILMLATSAGARLFQYRNKTASMKDAYREAVPLRRAATEAGAIFIVNDRCDLALAVEADGVHLGQTDLPLADARGILGSRKIIGISTHRPEQVKEAADGGADYLGFGPIFPTDTKGDHESVVGVAGLRHIRPLTQLPIFAIGGMTPENALAAIQAGADGIAVISSVLDAPDVAASVRNFIRRF